MIIERDSFLSTIRDKSRLEENAANKISDTRNRDSVVTDRNVQTAHSLSESGSIKDKLSEYKYLVAEQDRERHSYNESYKTETQLHEQSIPDNTTENRIPLIKNEPKKGKYETKGITDEKKHDQLDNVLSRKYDTQKKNDYSYVNQTEALKNAEENYQLGTHEKATISSKYSTLRSNSFSPDARIVPVRSTNFKGGQIRYGMTEQSTGKGSTGSKYVTDVKTITTGKYALEGSSPNKAVERLRSYNVSSVVIGKDITKPIPTVKSGNTKPKTDKYGKRIPSTITSKAKGVTETKARNIGKTRNLRKDTIGKKITGTKTASGRFQKKISSDKRISAKTKVQTAAVAAVSYKLSENTDRNASVEAARSGINTAGSMYSKLNMKRNNANAQKFLHKSKAYRTAKVGGGSAQKSSGKYVTKASRSLTKAQVEQRKALAAKKAMHTKQLKKFRQAKAREERIFKSFEEVKQTVVKVAKKLAEFAKRNATVTITIGVFIVIVIMISAGLGSCTMALASGTGTYMSGMSAATDQAMTDCDSYFTEKEMLLQEVIDGIKEEHPDFDEYIYDVDEVGHEPLKLMAYLAAVYEDYDLIKVKGVLDEIFEDMYGLELEEKVEQRIKLVYNEYTGEYEEQEVDVDVLYVTMKKKTWEEVISDRFPDAPSRERYDIYDDTQGAHQAFYNPFDIDWSQKITSRFGWRIHPTLGYEKFHNGIDIGMPSGTEIHACATGTVITATYSETAGNYVVIQDASGYTTHYMHMTSYSVSVGQEVKHGDIIGKVGSTGRSTGPHLHLGIKDASGNWINPEFMVSTYTGGDE